MNETKPKLDLPDLDHYEVGRRNFPAEELAKYAGLCVAFSSDGMRILASGDTMAELEKRLVAIGLEPSQVVESYVMLPDEVLL